MGCRFGPKRPAGFNRNRLPLSAEIACRKLRNLQSCLGVERIDAGPRLSNAPGNPLPGRRLLRNGRRRRIREGARHDGGACRPEARRDTHLAHRGLQTGPGSGRHLLLRGGARGSKQSRLTAAGSNPARRRPDARTADPSSLEPSFAVFPFNGSCCPFSAIPRPLPIRLSWVETGPSAGGLWSILMTPLRLMTPIRMSPLLRDNACIPVGFMGNAMPVPAPISRVMQAVDRELVQFLPADC